MEAVFRLPACEQGRMSKVRLTDGFHFESLQLALPNDCHSVILPPPYFIYSESTFVWRLIFICVMSLVAGCALVPTSPDEPRATTVYVTSNGFHSGIIVRKADVPRNAWPEVDQIPDHAWVEIGWGSEIFYRAEKITPAIVLGAMVPNASVLHVVGWDAPPEETYMNVDLVRLELDQSHFSELCRHVHESYHLDENGRPEYLGPGIYGDSAFVRADGKYYFPNTCNVWTARALRKGGVWIVPELCSTADAVLFSARAAGTTISRR